MYEVKLEPKMVSVLIVNV